MSSLSSFTSEKLAKQGRFPCPLVMSSEIQEIEHDSIVIVSTNTKKLHISKAYTENLAKQAGIDHSIEKAGCVIPIEKEKWLIYAPTGPINRDYDDVRRFGDAASKGIKRAVETGSKKPLIVIEPEKYPEAVAVGVLGALEALYLPLQFREDQPAKNQKVAQLGVWIDKAVNKTKFYSWIVALESARCIARDIGGGDPERMAPPRISQYVKKTFEGTPIKVEIITDPKIFAKEYPLFEAVNRAASVIDRHAGQIIYLTYEGKGPITQTIMPVGKGITYDTGGADIKAGGIMAGMSRDKCGAAAIVGFFQYLALEQPKGVKVIGGLPFCRNSVGENCFVADEVMTIRSGLRVRIGNTDAEGRMAMADCLCKMKEIALNEVNPHLITIATLTGHAIVSYGPYSAVLDNGPAKQEGCALKLQMLGESIGEMFEISSLRREDYAFNKGQADGEDLVQFNTKGNARSRGHQVPAAFLIDATGLDHHALHSKKPLKFTHFDVAGSAGEFPLNPTAVPVLALCKLARGDAF